MELELVVALGRLVEEEVVLEAGATASDDLDAQRVACLLYTSDAAYEL